MKIENIRENFPNIKIKSTQKLFYKKYIASVLLLNSYDRMNPYYIGLWVGKFKKEKRPNIKILNRYCSCSIFFENIEDVIDFLNNFEGTIKECNIPLNKKHKDLIDEEKENVIIRKNKFFYKYRYRITFKDTWNSDLSEKEIKDWAEDVFEDYIVGGGWYLTTLCIDSQDDVLIAKISHAEHISKIDRILLHSEIEDE